MACAAALQFTAGQEWLHPTIMRCDQIEAHQERETDAGRGILRCHQKNAIMAPTA
jgi:hypothetical protein